MTAYLLAAGACVAAYAWGFIVGRWSAIKPGSRP
jgi:hypothetical protein